MLIYNYQKEFMGMDEKDLKTLGFSNLSQLRAESADFADLFVRTPGFIHNFKHVHWIDFIACADPSEVSKVIIDVNGKTFKASLSIETIYLTDSPSSKAYLIQLNNLKVLSSKETENISTELAQRPTPIAAVDVPNNSTPIKEVFIQEETPLPLGLNDYSPQEEVTPSTQETSFATDIPDSIEMEDFNFKDEVKEEIVPSENHEPEYNYDPQVASDELGLPIDLIEEFIQDFIAQANEFKEGLYTSLTEDDIANVRVLSHKLKGVAANLRIEDAFNILSVINTSEDTNEIKSNLDSFYKIIAKLSGKELHEDKLELISPEPEIQEDDLSFAQDINLDLTEDIPKEIPETTSPTTLYSKKQIANEIGLDKETFEELFQDFLTETKTSIETMNLALKDENISKLQQEAIKLKGMSENMRITSIDTELDTIINSSDKNDMTNALKQIKIFIETISK